MDRRALAADNEKRACGYRTASSWGSTMNEFYRPPKSQRNIGLMGMVIFSPFVAMAIVDAPLQDTVSLTVLVLGVFGLFEFIGIWMLLDYWRASLSVDADEIVQRGVLRTKELQLSEVTAARWVSVGVGGKLVLTTPSCKIKLEFREYAIDDPSRLIEFFRSRIDSRLQQGWALFCHKIALPMRERHDDPGPRKNEVVLTRRRWDLYLVPAILISAGIGFYLWWALDEMRFLAGFVGLTIVWIWLRLMTPKAGMVDPRISAIPVQKGLFICWAVSFSIMFVVFLVVCVAKAEIPPFVSYTALGIAVGGLLLGSYLADRTRQRAEAKATPESVRRWESRELPE